MCLGFTKCNFQLYQNLIDEHGKEQFERGLNVIELVRANCDKILSIQCLYLGMDSLRATNAIKDLKINQKKASKTMGYRLKEKVSEDSRALKEKCASAALARFETGNQTNEENAHSSDLQETKVNYGEKDVVFKCRACGKEEIYDPNHWLILQHRKNSPSCTRMKKVKFVNIEKDDKSLLKNAFIRKLTFQTFPKSKTVIEKLVSEGFYYTGYGDLVRSVFTSDQMFNFNQVKNQDRYCPSTKKELKENTNEKVDDLEELELVIYNENERPLVILLKGDELRIDESWSTYEPVQVLDEIITELKNAPRSDTESETNTVETEFFFVLRKN